MNGLSFRGSQLVVTASHLMSYAFCPRFFYFKYVLDVPEHEERHFKVTKGHQWHRKREKVNPDYLRKNLHVIDRKISVHLFANQGLYSGIVDEILILDDGTMAPLDYKWAQWQGKIFDTYLLQLTFYAFLIEKKFQTTVNKAFLVFLRSKNKVISLDIGPSEYLKLTRVLSEISYIQENGWYPLTTPSRQRCNVCAYRNICDRI